MYESILYRIEDSIVTISLNRPDHLNALTHDTISEIDAALDRAVADGARALVLTGAGRAFCSGGDLGGDTAEFRDGDLGIFLEELWNPVVEKFASLPFPTLSAINGAAAGAGVAFALGVDLAVADRSAYFQLAFSKVGLIADAGTTWLLANSIGRQRTMELLLLSERLSAERAESWGLIHRVVEDGQALGYALELAARLARGPSLAYASQRSSVRVALESDFTTSLATERKLQVACGRSADFQEGVQAFKERRPPKYIGR
jgi:2-(1,2-epoxy-1,2-dihydrophenyl)acetyl-CoA isomerase